MKLCLVVQWNKYFKRVFLSLEKINSFSLDEKIVLFSMRDWKAIIRRREKLKLDAEIYIL